MSAEITEKFHVKNLDWASCAAKIERGLEKVEGVDDVTVDFANLMLHMRTNDIQRIIKEVRRIEPNVVLIPESKISLTCPEDQVFQDINKIYRDGSAACYVSMLISGINPHRHCFSCSLETQRFVKPYCINICG